MSIFSDFTEVTNSGKIKPTHKIPDVRYIYSEKLFLYLKILIYQTRHVCEKNAPDGNNVPIRQNSSCPTFCVRHEKPFGELTVQIWLMSSHLDIRYCTLCKRNGIKYRQINRQSSRPFRTYRVHNNVNYLPGL